METLFGKFLQYVPPPPSKAYCNYFSTEVKQRYIFPEYIYTPLHFHPLFLSGWVWTRLDSVYLSHSHSTPPPFSEGPAPEGGRVGGAKVFFLFYLLPLPPLSRSRCLGDKTSSQKQQFARVAGLGCGCAHWRVCVSARARVSVCAFLFSYRVQC